MVEIGPFFEDPAESVSCINRSFVHGLRDQYRFIPLNANRRYGNTRQAALNGVNLCYFGHQLLLCLTHLIRHRPKIVHYAISAGWAMEKGLAFMKLARAFGAKTLGHIHSGGMIDHWLTLPRRRKRFALHELMKLDGLVVLSEGWRATIATRLGLSKDKLFVVNNPIDPEFEEAAQQLSLERQETVLLALGVMGRPKGVFDLLAAVNVLSHQANFHIFIVGPEREPDIYRDVQQYIADHSLSDIVSVKSTVWGQEKLELFRRASIFVLPSHCENFPLVVLEAAAAGQAIVTTPVGAVPEFFRDGVSARFVPPRDPESMAHALSQLIARPGERLRLAGAARDTFASRLARARIMNSLDHVYQTLLGHPRRQVCA